MEKVKKTYNNFAKLAAKVILFLYYLQLSSLYKNKKFPILPDNVNPLQSALVDELIQKLNLYLAELWQDPATEFIKFLQKDTFKPVVTPTDLDSDKRHSKLESLTNENKERQGLDYLKRRKQK